MAGLDIAALLKGVGILAAIGVFAWVVIRLRQGAADALERRRQSKQLKDAEDANEIHGDVTRLPDGAALDELRKSWNRDKLR